MRYIMRALLALLGWKIKGDFPSDKKMVVIFAPHTSNWDFVLMLMVRFCYKMKPAFLGKHTLFKAPTGWFFRMLGGIPVERSSSHNIVDQVVKVLKQREEVTLALAPEGTRSKTSKWKSGFYYIALKAKVPLLMAYLDSETKTIGFGDKIELSGNTQVDLQKIKDFYKDKRGIRPELESEIAFEVKDN